MDQESGNKQKQNQSLLRGLYVHRSEESGKACLESKSTVTSGGLQTWNTVRAHSQPGTFPPHTPAQRVSLRVSCLATILPGQALLVNHSTCCTILRPQNQLITYGSQGRQNLFAEFPIPSWTSSLHPDLLLLPTQCPRQSIPASTHFLPCRAQHLYSLPTYGRLSLEELGYNRAGYPASETSPV